jgi:hypothetical protein
MFDSEKQKKKLFVQGLLLALTICADPNFPHCHPSIPCTHYRLRRGFPDRSTALGQERGGIVTMEARTSFAMSNHLVRLVCSCSFSQGLTDFQLLLVARPKPNI